MPRLGHGGVSKCYAPITAFPAQSPDHIPACFLSVHTDCLYLYVSSQQSYYLLISLFLSFYLTAFFSQRGASTRPESSQMRTQTCWRPHSPWFTHVMWVR